MSTQSTVVTSRRRQHELLRSWSTWAMTSILLDPSEVARVRESGWAGTHHHDAPTGLRIVGTTDGVGLGFGVGDSWHSPAEVIPWSEIEAVARGVPDDVRNQLGEFRSRWRAHQSAYPRFTASAAAVGCGPITPGQPLTPRQEAYVRELDAFEASGVLPAWEEKYVELDVQRLELHERALAAVLDQEPADLLDLLEDQHLSQPAAKAAIEPERRTRAHGETTTSGSDRQLEPMRIRNYTGHQRTALENLSLPKQFTFICERKTAHCSERVVFEYLEGDRCDSVILDVDDRARGYLDAGAAVLVARAHQRYQQQARNSTYTESARAMSSRAADLLGAWLGTHPSPEVHAWQTGQDTAAAERAITGKRPALTPPPERSPNSNDRTRALAARPASQPCSRA
ncbi:MAG TPA: hypothetical protein PLZ93_11285 [Nocardioides sp.]|uniref:hypothetical protein n=1 Tax=uncultured Nocardioides sp. TaxID=198441 RepID=UPI00261F9D59|nr:hypothetical protein [uncultured Nocardioides sp.]HRD60646.1 hypothetical protein [Nocardioides sp.]HRI96190.1 hypothetical protein [Nocardioides sp.]HRK47624.1 hypothetical protein [Nocardioides sp.]